MSRRPLALAGLGLAGLLAAARAAPDPAVVATDRAHEAMAAGDPGRAAQLLAAALADAPPEAADRLRCLRGEALLDAGDPAGAEAVFTAVGAEAPCARRAAWGRVEALARLGRADGAATLAETLGAALAGDDRDGATAQALAALAERLGDDPDRDGLQARQLLGVALGLAISDERAAALADALAARTTVGWDGMACQGQLRALAAREDPDRRFRAARACGPLVGPVLADPLPEPLRSWAHGAGAFADDLATEVWWTRAVDHPGAAPWMAADLARWRADRGDLGARDALFGLGPDDAARSVALSVEAGLRSDAAAAADRWLAAWPAHPRRAEIVGLRGPALSELARERFAAGDGAGALAAWRGLADDPTFGALAVAESGFAELAAGRVDGARDAWERVRARFPNTDGAALATRALARLRLAEAGREAAEAFLRDAIDRERDAAAAEELGRLRGEDVWIETRSVDRGDPVVRVGARNLAEVELRLHAVDPEAWFRSGGDVAGLSELDVAAIAPDRRWTVPVEAPPGRDVVLDVPVKVPRPGLYAVTAAAPAEEARALVLVSDLRLVTRTVAGDTAVAALDAFGRPVAGARVLLVDGEVVEGRTGPDGLFVDRTGRAPRPLVAVERAGHWAFAPRPSDSERATRGLELATEVDRPAYLPEDRVGLRVVAHREGRPLAGRWSIWLEGGAVRHVDAGADGVLTLDLPVPPRTPGGPRRDRLALLGVPPGEAAPQPLTTIRVASPDPLARTIRAELDPDGAVAWVEGPHGEPLAGALVRCEGALDPAHGEPASCGDALTDAAGRARFAGPRADLPWTATLALEDGPSTRVSRDAERPEPVELRIAEDHLRPGEAPRARVRGGGATLVLVRFATPSEPPRPPPDPWVREPEEGLRGLGRVRGDEPPPRGPTEVVARLEVPPGEGWVDALGLPPLPPGRYAVRAVRGDGQRAASASVSLRVDEALRVTGARDIGLGESLSLVPSGPALLTAEGDGLLWAAVRPAGAAAEVAPDARWRGEVTIAASGADGSVHARRIQADPDPVITLSATSSPDGATWTVRAEVRDHAGRPVDADVSFAAWDQRLEAAVDARPAALAPFGRVADPAGWLGFLDFLADGDAGEPIAGALLAEAALRRERDKAKTALESGLLSDNALAEAMRRELPVGAIGLGGIGSHGSGMGGGGSASGYGRGGGTFGGARAEGLPGMSARALWQVVRARGGVAEVAVPLPPARWRLRATALAGEGVSTAFVDADATRRVWGIAPEPGPGAPGDAASPVLVAVNGTDAPVRARLGFGPDAPEVTLPPGTHPVTGPRVAAGSGVAITLGPDTWTWTFPLAEGAPAADGPVSVSVASRAEAAFRAAPDAEWTAGRWAHHGRAALLLGDLDRAWAARDALAQARPSRPLDASAVAAFLAEGRERLDVGDAELAAALDAVSLAGSAEERAAAALALRLGGRDVPADEVPAPAVDPAGPPPRPGTAALVDWLRARPEGPVAWKAGGLPTGDLPPALLRVPAAAGRPRPVSWADGLDDARCDPCSVGVGDALWDASGVAAGALPVVHEAGGAPLLLAAWPGTFTLAGGTRAVRVEVGDAPTTPVPRPWSRPTAPLPDDPGPLARAAARAGFEAALRAGDDAAVADAYATLLRIEPAVALPVADRARAARALRAVGRPEGAVAAWRAAADAAFVAEVKGLERARAITGDLVVVQKTREAALRYPEVPSVGSALAVLPGQLLALAEALPPEVVAAGIDATDVRLTAAAWDREFLATSPDHPRAAAAGLRLGRTFLALHAPDEALRWATRVADSHPDDPLRDALLFLRAAAATEAGEADRAEPWLRSLADDVFAGPDGQPRRSEHAADARMALGRLLEARGRLSDAVATYREAGGAEADAAIAVLTARALAAPPLVVLGPGDRATLPVEARGVAEVDVRAWRVDVRTLFLRDGGLGGVASVAVDGLAPAWSGRRPLRAGPYPRSIPVDLPLAGTGAWLVQLDAEGVHAAALVVRSALTLAVSPAGRVDLRRGDGPAAGAEVRALVGGGVEPAVTDVRGVAQVTPGAPVLAWLGEEVAFTPPAAPGARLPSAPRAPAASPVDVLDRRLEHERARDDEAWQELLR